ncbi:MAG: hypothetical protein ACRYFK_15515 [Janthinobacterium lividum]
MSDSPEYPGTNSIAGNTTSPSVADTKMGIDVQNTLTNSNTQAPDAQAQPEGGAATTSQELTTDPNAAVPNGAQPDYAAGTDAAPAPSSQSGQPDVYGGNFGNDVQPTFNDPNRVANQQSTLNRGAFGEQGHLGATHGGYGNQFREFDTAAERPAAEPTEEKYYGEGASRPGPQHNAYRDYDGQDTNPAEQGHAVRDTPAPPVHNAEQPTLADGRGNSHDTRNLPSRGGPDAAFQNDNGAPTVGPAYAADYGSTSGVHLPAGTPSNHLDMGPNGHGEVEDQHSSRGGYDNQGAQGGRAHDSQPGAAGGAPAPVDAPNAPQGEGYGYGHERSEQAKPGNPDTGDSRSGFGPGGSKEGNASEGYGSKGGSYDDENPGAQTPAYDDFTKQDKAQNYGQEARQENRPADGDQPQDSDYGPTPRRNAGRDK